VTKWEYRIVDLTQGESSEPWWNISLPENSGEPQMLEILGEQGWELTTITTFDADDGEGQLELHRIYYFKRPITQ
jgi:hypothetical protein